jgi:transcriptional regulator with XRE-family HTH domain
VPVNNHRHLQRDLGRRIAEVRAERGLTQEALAEKVEVSVRYVQSVEGGRENLTVETLAKLGNTLRVAVAALFTVPATRKVKRGRPVRVGKK